MQRREHQCNGASVRMSNDVDVGETECIHDSDDTIGSGSQARIQSVDALRFTHVEHVDGIDTRLLSEGIDVVAPVCTGAD